MVHIHFKFLIKFSMKFPSSPLLHNEHVKPSRGWNSWLSELRYQVSVTSIMPKSWKHSISTNIISLILSIIIMISSIFFIKNWILILMQRFQISLSCLPSAHPRIDSTECNTIKLIAFLPLLSRSRSNNYISCHGNSSAAISIKSTWQSVYNKAYYFCQLINIDIASSNFNQASKQESRRRSYRKVNCEANIVCVVYPYISVHIPHILCLCVLRWVEILCKL